MTDIRNKFKALEEEGTQDEGDLAELDAGHWERLEEIKITVDSGAVDTVGPPAIAPAMTMWETQASQEGKYYRAANNTKIPIYGMKELRGYTQDGERVGMDIQIAQVKRHWHR